MNTLAAILCVFLFALTAPFTRMAALETTAEAIIIIRILGAAVVCLISVLMDKWIPPRNVWKGIFFTALGSVIGFNSLMAFGLREVPAGHAAVALAGLPLATSIYSALRDRLNPGMKFWLFAVIGTLLSLAFFFSMNMKNILAGDIYLLLSVLAASFGYVEGGRISRVHGGARTMSWAVLITLPFILPFGIYYFYQIRESFGLSLNGWLSVSYVALVSQSLGMFLWFRVLAIGPMEKVAQVQLLQPFFTLFAAIILLNETVIPSTWIVAGLVALCIFGSNKAKAK